MRIMSSSIRPSEAIARRHGPQIDLEYHNEEGSTAGPSTFSLDGPIARTLQV
jgi:hypothetical protein